MYALSKLLELLLSPGNMLVLILTAGVAMQWARWPRYGLYLATASAALFLVLVVFPVGDWLVKPLEDEFTPKPLPHHVDGILVLGGTLDPEIYVSRGVPSEDPVEGRLVAALKLSRLHPEARIVFSGGSGAIFGTGIPEAAMARLALLDLGVDPRKLVFEDRSRNTWENILFTKELVRPKPGGVWVLATSASQLPRAMEVAARLHWRLIPWPTDYSTPARNGPLLGFDLSGNLVELNRGVHEWTGIIAYRMLGRSSPPIQ